MYLLTKLRHGIKQPDIIPETQERLLNFTPRINLNLHYEGTSFQEQESPKDKFSAETRGRNKLRMKYQEIKHEIQPKSEMITPGELNGYQSKAAKGQRPPATTAHITLKQQLVSVKRALSQKLNKMTATDLHLLFQIAMKKYPKQMPSTEFHLSTEQTRHFFYLELFQHRPAITRLIKLFHILHIIKILARSMHRTKQNIKLEGLIVKEYDLESLKSHEMKEVFRTESNNDEGRC